MKTPDEIKKGLECCMFGHCSYCPYSAEHGCDCSEHLGNDVREFHQQLESQNAELLTRCEQLTAKCHQLERERDAAVACIPRVCKYCKHDGPLNAWGESECELDSVFPNGCLNGNTGWEWRGVKEE